MIKEMIQAALEASLIGHGTSCSGSRFMNGTLDMHEAVRK